MIIGAGPSGIITAVRFKKKGIKFDIVDKGNTVGGMWDISRQSAVYSTAHFISSKTQSGFLDYPMPNDYPDYPNHQKILQYIQDYATKNQITDQVKFNQEVTSIHKNKNQQIEVEFNGDRLQIYRGVIIANGRNWYPNEPDYQGPFEGEQMHSFHYKEPSQLIGKNVLIVGAGNSGCDIACDAAKFAKRAFLSQRRGYYFIPKYVFGIPSDVFANKGPTLPTRLEQAVFQFLLNKILVGDVTKFGLPKPDHKIFESHPIMNTQVLNYLGHGDLTPKPDIEVLRSNSVKFKNGTIESVDLIIYATGYKQLFPFIKTDLLPQVNGLPDLYYNIFSKTEDEIFLVGYMEADGGLFPLACLQADLISGLIARNLSGEQDNWDRFHALKRKDFPDFSGGTNYLPTERHAYYTKSEVYQKKIKNLIKKFG